MKNSNLLVSVCVITYNSAKFVLETLDSIKRQTYTDIELIISDDCSIDNTVSLCSNWLELNEKRFIRTELITSNINTGISANCNRAIMKTAGVYIKLIAGDDILIDTCIQKCLLFCLETGSKIIFAKQIVFVENIENTIKSDEKKYDRNPLFVKELSIDEQKRFLLKKYVVDGPTFFWKKDVWEAVGGINEKYPFIDDISFMLSVLEHGIKIRFYNENVVYYRMNLDSITHSMNKLFSQSYKHRRLFNLDCRYKYLTLAERLGESYVYWVCNLMDYLSLNKRNLFCKIIYYCAMRINFFRYI